MAGRTISGKVTKTVIIGPNGYPSPLTISSSGSIVPGSVGGIGVYDPSTIANAVIINDGFIGAGAGSTGHGGIAVKLNAAATLTNAATIEGATGGSANGDGALGGAGVYALAVDSVSNSGLIEAGAGGYGYGQGGNGGIGVQIQTAGAMLTNTGSGLSHGIIGGAGGGGHFDGGDGGAGVDVAGGVAMNSGLIEGGVGGYHIAGANTAYGKGGAGVYMVAGSLINLANGAIQGGGGGAAEQSAIYGGTGGIGVFTHGGSVSNLGTIIGGAGAASTYYEMQPFGLGGHGGIGLEAYGAGATVSNAGTIIGGAGGYGVAGGGDGGAGSEVYDGASMTNTGIIIGGAGATLPAKMSGGESGYGGYGIIVRNSTFSNIGSVMGGAGGIGYNGRSGGGGFISHSTLTNSGLITGGTAAVGVNTGNAVLNNSGTIAGGYGGGEGLNLGTESNAVNSGTIIGGTGASAYYQGGKGGLGVSVFGGSTLTNSNLIAGGYGGYGGYHNREPGTGGNGGAGAYIGNGVLINAGTISGGAGGAGIFYGTLGDAVAFSGAGTLVVENGAVFIGDVVATTAFNDVLELAGTSSTALTGIGTQFTNFADISFASGAAWTIAGNTIGLGGATVSGFAMGDTIVVDGFAETGASYESGGLDLAAGTAIVGIALGTSLSGDLLISSDGTNSTLSIETSISSITLTAGQDAFVLQHGKASDIVVTSGGVALADYGGKITSTTIEAHGAGQAFSGGIMYHNVVDKNADLYVGYGGTAVTTTIKKGGMESVNGGGITSNTVIDGGTLDLVNSGGVTGTLKFKGKGGVLEVDQTEIPTTVISGFKAGDKVELLDAASGIGTVTVTKANVVTISADGMTYKLNIAGAKVGATNFHFSGYALTETTKKMAIQRPAEPARNTAAAHAVPDLAAAGGYQAMAAAPAAHSPWTASAAVHAAPVHDLIRVPHGGIQTMVTLQSG
jgi:hypothetical protein